MVRKEGPVSDPTGFRLYRLVNLVRLVKVFLSEKLFPTDCRISVQLRETNNSVHLATVIKKQVDASDIFSFGRPVGSVRKEFCYIDFIPQAVSSSRFASIANSKKTQENMSNITYLKIFESKTNATCHSLVALRHPDFQKKTAQLFCCAVQKHHRSAQRRLNLIESLF
ncbi:hypothetical protein [Rubinisphaera italica]|uniref:Uncharacterized protein n=1 Tax=Rubinisphaera italica TaxID=2527969 RepID=A0A5C5XM25_9PLAN|nr:hypothetical protein [Rubinisphaera italica]TWT63511.1 hypothetical protein Pan54_42640 [Rubinisphaera italica]